MDLRKTVAHKKPFFVVETSNNLLYFVGKPHYSGVHLLSNCPSLEDLPLA